jgi:hypothetical protein
MSLFAKLFGKESTSGKKANKKSLYESDNLGTRHDTSALANAYWLARIASIKKEPFVMYTFENEKDAIEAMLELPCIHVAEDTQKLICSEVLIFGYYQIESGKYEAVIGGDELSHDLWSTAKNSFEKHNGKFKNDLEPEKKAAVPKKSDKPKIGKVTFVREDRMERMGHTMIYRIHKGPDAVSAKAFLEKNPVNKQFYYLVVETPEGNYCRDIQGMYKE